MGASWTVKKYMDDIFTAGHGILYASDGRSRSDASKKYGSGGHRLHIFLQLKFQVFQNSNKMYEKSKATSSISVIVSLCCSSVSVQTCYKIRRNRSIWQYSFLIAAILSKYHSLL